MPVEDDVYYPHAEYTTTHCLQFTPQVLTSKLNRNWLLDGWKLKFSFSQLVEAFTNSFCSWLSSIITFDISSAMFSSTIGKLNRKVLSAAFFKNTDLLLGFAWFIFILELAIKTMKLYYCENSMCRILVNLRACLLQLN